MKRSATVITSQNIDENYEKRRNMVKKSLLYSRKDYVVLNLKMVLYFLFGEFLDE